MPSLKISLLTFSYSLITCNFSWGIKYALNIFSTLFSHLEIWNENIFIMLWRESVSKLLLHKSLLVKLVNHVFHYDVKALFLRLKSRVRSSLMTNIGHTDVFHGLCVCACVSPEPRHRKNRTGTVESKAFIYYYSFIHIYID